jgi:hypothetical protein
MSSTASFVSEQWLNLIFGIIGIVGTYLTYRSWRSMRDSEKAYQHLFQLAELHIDKSLTEKELADRKAEVQDEARKIESLQNQIRQDIPLAARRAVLRDRYETQLNHLQDIHSSLEKARNELNRLGVSVELPTEIKSAIEKEIQPEYAIRARKSDLRGYLTIATAGAAIASALLPYPFSRAASWIILVVFALPIVVLLLRLSWPSNAADIRRQAIYLLNVNLGWIGLALIVVGIAAAFAASADLRFYLGVRSEFLLLMSAGLMLTGIGCLLLKCALWIRRRFFHSGSAPGTTTDRNGNQTTH